LWQSMIYLWVLWRHICWLVHEWWNEIYICMSTS
jgi:hypothetical protein